MDVKDLIYKWYRLLGFPSSYDKAFFDALNDYGVSADTSIETYDLECGNGALNLLSFLYMCEETKRKYIEKEIPDCVLIDTLKDIKVLADTYYRIGYSFYLGELWWLKRHLTLKLFKLGRLQFSFGEAEYSDERIGLHIGDAVMEVHIDEIGPLRKEACDHSFEMANAFFEKYYPEYHFDFYICESWILGSTVKNILPDGSNLSAFRDRFQIVGEKESDSILQYLFKWDSTRENVKMEIPTTKLAEKVKREAEQGTPFYEGYGVIPHKS